MKDLMYPKNKNNHFPAYRKYFTMLCLDHLLLSLVILWGLKALAPYIPRQFLDKTESICLG